MSGLHTPGPWHLYTGGERPARPAVKTANDRVHICSLSTSIPSPVSDGRPREQALADGRLIAAAPELLTALQAARDCILIDRTALADCHMHPATSRLDAEGAAGVAEYDATLAQIDAAIAKAVQP